MPITGTDPLCSDNRQALFWDGVVCFPLFPQYRNAQYSGYLQIFLSVINQRSEKISTGKLVLLHLLVCASLHISETILWVREQETAPENLPQTNERDFFRNFCIQRCSVVVFSNIDCCFLLKSTVTSSSMFMNVHMYSLLLLRVVDVSFLGHLFQCSNAKMSS